MDGWHSRMDGIYLLRASSLAEILNGSWFPYGTTGSTHRPTHHGLWGYRGSRPSAEQRGGQQHEHARERAHEPLHEPPRVLDGLHAGCIECRRGRGGACEYDGKLSLVHFRGRFLLFARANLDRSAGGRFVQVARSLSPDPAAGFAPFRRLRIGGYAPLGGGNIYFAAVSPNPIDRSTLLGLFPVTLTGETWCAPCGQCEPLTTGGGSGANITCDSAMPPPPRAFIGLSISCDGEHWAPLVTLHTTSARHNRSFDQPVDGMVSDGDAIHAYVHENVPGISPGHQHASLVPHRLHRPTLKRMTRAAHKHLPGCAVDAQTSL